MKWEELRMEVKNCEFAGCPRNRNKLPNCLQNCEFKFKEEIEIVLVPLLREILGILFQEVQPFVGGTFISV